MLAANALIKDFDAWVEGQAFKRNHSIAIGFAHGGLILRPISELLAMMSESRSKAGACSRKLQLPWPSNSDED
jgi:hypothetical protein